MGIHAQKTIETSTTVQTPGAGGVCGAGKRASPPAPDVIKAVAAAVQPAQASNCIIAKFGLTATIERMTSADLRTLKGAVGNAATAKRAQEQADDRKRKEEEAAAKRQKKQEGDKAREDAKAEKQRQREQAAENKKAQADERDLLKTAADQAFKTRKALRRVTSMSLGQISAALRDETSDIAKAVQFVKENVDTIGAIPVYVTPGTDQSPAWGVRATGHYRMVLRAVDFIFKQSRDPFASAFHRDNAFNIRAHATWAGIGLDAEAEPESGSDDDDNEPITNLARKRPAQSPARDSSGESDDESDDSAVEFDENGDFISYKGGAHLMYGDLPPEKRPRVKIVDADTTAVLPPLPVAAEADPLMPADFAAMHANDAGGWTYDPTFTPPPGPGSGDEDMPPLPGTQ